MHATPRKGPRLSDAQRRKAVTDVIAFFQDERGEEIGIIAAEAVLDMFMRDVGPALHASGIEDARAAVRAAAESLDVDLAALEVN